MTDLQVGIFKMQLCCTAELVLGTAVYHGQYICLGFCVICGGFSLC